MGDRAEFEKQFPVPEGAIWSEKKQGYYWSNYPTVAHPVNDDWEVWQGAEPVGYTNWAQLAHIKTVGEGAVYSDTDHGCDIALYTDPKPAQQSNQEDVVALLTNALANIRDTDASAKTLQSMAALALRASKEVCDE